MRRVPLKTTVAVILAAFWAALWAAVAVADPPTITPSPATDYVDTTCGFPVSVHFAVNDQTAKTFTSGTTIITGPLFAELSTNSKSITLNISGPAKATVSDGSAFIVGHGVGFGPTVTPNGLVLMYTAGVVSISTSPTLEGVLEHGTVLLNICTALAP
jgi:hypothetical protein